MTIYQHIPSWIRRRYYAAVALIGVVGTLEVFSLSALLAFFTTGLSAGIGNADQATSGLVRFSGFEITSELLLVLALGLFVLKTWLTLMVGRHSFRTSMLSKRSIQDQIFKRLLFLPYRHQLGDRSSEWVRSVTVDCNSLEGRLFMPILVLLGEVIPALCIAGVLSYINFYAFIAASAMFSVVGISVYKLTNQRLVQYGQEQVIADGRIVQLVQQAFQGLRELKVYHQESRIGDQFQSNTVASNEAIYRALTLGLLPRFFFETAVYLFLGILVLFYVVQGVSWLQIVAELAVFGAASMRLLPSVSKIVSHLQSLKHAGPSTTVVSKLLDHSVEMEVAASEKDVQALAFERLELDNLDFRFGDEAVVKGLCLEINKGDILGIVGPSGSGKSTLLNLLLGLLQPTDGSVLLNGTRLLGQERNWWGCIGYVPQEPYMLNDNLIANVTLNSQLSELEQDERAQKLLRELDLQSNLIDSACPIGENGSLISGGQRQRVALARALYRCPQVLFLDESTSAMDVETQQLAMEIVARYMQDKTVIMISHRHETLAFCNKILELPDGTISRGRNS